MERRCDDIAELVLIAEPCLLDSVETWDEHHIVCRATSHLRPDNPFTRRRRPPRTLCAIEYGAQAIAARMRRCSGWA